MTQMNEERSFGRRAAFFCGAAAVLVLQTALALWSPVSTASAQTSPVTAAGLPNATAQRLELIRGQRRTNELLERIANQLEKNNAAAGGKTSGR